MEENNLLEEYKQERQKILDSIVELANIDGELYFDDSKEMQILKRTYNLLLGYSILELQNISSKEEGDDLV